jgi:ABC-2 type transport system permease protein
MLSLYNKEIQYYFRTSTGYIALFFLCLLSWLFCWIFPATSFLNFGYAEMGSFFNVMPYLLVVLIPALTMRLLAEEQQKNTLGLLFVLPIKSAKIILAKYLAGVTVIVLCLLLSLVNVWSLSRIASPVGNIDVSGIAGSYLGLLVLAMCLFSIGLWCSSFSSNSILAYIVALVIGYMMYDGFTQLAQIQLLPSIIKNTLEYLSFSTHYNAMGRGVLVIADVLYFVAITLFFLYLSWLNLDNNKA